MNDIDSPVILISLRQREKREPLTDTAKPISKKDNGTEQTTDSLGIFPHEKLHDCCDAAVMRMHTRRPVLLRANAPSEHRRPDVAGAADASWQGYMGCQQGRPVGRLA
jgi:hypothetical protein